MATNSPAYYAVICAEVRYCKNLEPNAKLLYGEITALCNQEGYCWASNKYFAELYDVDESSVKRWIKSLEEEDFIKIQTERKGFKLNRKIYISQIIFTKAHFRAPEGSKMSPRRLKNEPYNNTSNNTSIIHEVCTDSVGPLIPKKSLKKEKLIIERIARRELVTTSNEEHAELIKKYGESLTEKCYDALQEWLTSAKENNSKVVDKHTCYYRITSWVVKKVKEGEQNENRSGRKSNYRSGSGYRTGGNESSIKQGIYIDGVLQPE